MNFLISERRFLFWAANSAELGPEVCMLRSAGGRHVPHFFFDYVVPQELLRYFLVERVNEKDSNGQDLLIPRLADLVEVANLRYLPCLVERKLTLYDRDVVVPKTLSAPTLSKYMAHMGIRYSEKEKKVFDG